LVLARLPIAGGTDEILRKSSPSEYRLPPEVRLDRDIPFNKINK